MLFTGGGSGISDDLLSAFGPSQRIKDKSALSQHSPLEEHYITRATLHCTIVVLTLSQNMLQIDRTKILKKRHSSSSSSDAGRFSSPQRILPINNETRSAPALNLNKVPVTAPIKILDKGNIRPRGCSEDANASSYNSSAATSVQFYTSTIGSSSMSDLEDWPDEPVGDWLNEEVEETARSDSSDEKSVVPYDEAPSKLTAEQKALRDMLVHVEDLRFTSLPESTQHGILNTIILREYSCLP